MVLFAELLPARSSSRTASPRARLGHDPVPSPLAFLFALAVETERHRPRAAVLLAERKGMVWLMLPFALFDLWHIGLATLFAYAAASFFWAQDHTHAALQTAED